MILEKHQSCSELLVVGSLLHFTYKVNFTQLPMYSKHRLHRIWHNDTMTQVFPTVLRMHPVHIGTQLTT